MALNVSFVLLKSSCKQLRKNDMSTTHFVLTFGNHFGDQFEQKLSCIVTLDDIITSSEFDAQSRQLASRLKQHTGAVNKQTLNDVLTLRNRVLSLFQSNTKMQLLLS